VRGFGEGADQRRRAWLYIGAKERPKMGKKASHIVQGSLQDFQSS